MSEGATKRDPPFTCRNSARVLRRPMAVTDYGTAGLMPTSACAPWLSAARAPCARLWSPYERGSRGASCGRAATVGRCVSRGCSCLDSTKRKARSGVRNPGAYRVLRPFKSIDPAGIQGLCRTDRAPKAASSTMPRVPRSCRVSQKSDNHQLSPPFLATQRQACQSEKHAQSPLVRQRSRFGSRLVTTHHNGAKGCSLCPWPLPT
jgi:hypothetical protein